MIVIWQNPTFTVGLHQINWSLSLILQTMNYNIHFLLRYLVVQLTFLSKAKKYSLELESFFQRCLSFSKECQ